MNKKTMLGSIFGIGKEQQYSDAAGIFRAPLSNYIRYFLNKSPFPSIIDYFTKAGNAYKLANNWQAAAEMFEKAADCWSLADAGKIFKYFYEYTYINEFYYYLLPSLQGV